MEKLKGEYPPLVLTDKINECVRQINRINKAVMEIAEAIETGENYQMAKFIEVILNSSIKE